MQKVVGSNPIIRFKALVKRVFLGAVLSIVVRTGLQSGP